MINWLKNRKLRRDQEKRSQVAAKQAAQLQQIADEIGYESGVPITLFKGAMLDYMAHETSLAVENYSGD